MSSPPSNPSAKPAHIGQSSRSSSPLPSLLAHARARVKPSTASLAAEAAPAPTDGEVQSSHQRLPLLLSDDEGHAEGETQAEPPVRVYEPSIEEVEGTDVTEDEGSEEGAADSRDPRILKRDKGKGRAAEEDELGQPTPAPLLRQLTDSRSLLREQLRRNEERVKHKGLEGDSGVPKGSGQFIPSGHFRHVSAFQSEGHDLMVTYH